MGPSGTVLGNNGNLRDVTFFLHTTNLPFNQEPSRILKGILQEAATTKDYMQACREAFDLIESHRLHQQREHVFKMVDQFKSGNAEEYSNGGDKGKGRDEQEWLK